MAPRNQKRGRKSRNAQGSRKASVNPPPLNSQPIFKRTFQWMGTLADNQNPVITRGCMLSQLLATTAQSGSTSFSFVNLMSAVRIRSVTVWIPGVVGSTLIMPLTFTWLSDLAPPVKLTRVALGSIATSFVTQPPVNSRAAMWSTSDSQSINESLFTIGLDDNSDRGDAICTVLISMNVEFVTATDVNSSFNVNSAGSSFSTGTYGNFLDCLDTSGNQSSIKIPPVGLPIYETNTSNLTGMSFTT